jgi:hypothetical protein
VDRISFRVGLADALCEYKKTTEMGIEMPHNVLCDRFALLWLNAATLSEKNWRLGIDYQYFQEFLLVTTRATFATS